MFEKLYHAIIYADEFKKILTGKSVSNLEVASAYIALLYDNIPIIGKNICAGFLRMGLDVVFNITPSGRAYSHEYKLYAIPRDTNGVCIGCDGAKFVVKVSENGYGPEDILESKSLEPRIFISKNFKEKTMKIIEKRLDISSIRLNIKKEILRKISAGGILHRL
ncbi:hypothetical protein V6M85_09980 [Sulfolobus tengchongensis]|uniref:Formylmethanofuran dehydrogenase subunit E domain-containing protein n=1 Tax=Sulfolobus tengchongensis TaxID=207809 RepID=A0AAX4L115_9CREN